MQELTQKPKRRVRKWVTASIIMDLTGRDSNWMRTARRQQILDVKRENGIVLYDLHSLPEIFLTGRNQS